MTNSKEQHGGHVIQNFKPLEWLARERILIREKLQRIGLGVHNSVVIGTGILTALGIGENNDLDIVTTVPEYDAIKKTGTFIVGDSYGQETLLRDGCEIRTAWEVLEGVYDFDRFKRGTESIVIDGVRYNTPEFLLLVKQDWQRRGIARPKDFGHIALIKAYLSQVKD